MGNVDSFIEMLIEATKSGQIVWVSGRGEGVLRWESRIGDNAVVVQVMRGIGKDDFDHYRMLKVNEFLLNDNEEWFGMEDPFSRLVKAIYDLEGNIPKSPCSEELIGLVDQIRTLQSASSTLAPNTV
jgi:hypothetical protein